MKTRRPLGSPPGIRPRFTDRWPGEERIPVAAKFRRDQMESGRMRELERELDRSDRRPEDFDRRELARREALTRREVDNDNREKIPVGVSGMRHRRPHPRHSPPPRLGALRDVTDRPRLRKQLMKDIKAETEREPTQPWAKARQHGDPNDPIVSEGLYKGYPKSRVPRAYGGTMDGLRKGKGSLGCGCGGGKSSGMSGCGCLGGSPTSDEAIRQAFVAAEDGDCARVSKALDKAEAAGANVSLHRRQLGQDCKIARGVFDGHRSRKRGKKGRMSHNIGLGDPPAHDQKATKRLAKAVGAVVKVEKAVEKGNCREAISGLVTAAKLVAAADEHQAAGSGIAKKEVNELSRKVERLKSQVGSICAVPKTAKKKSSARKPIK